MYGRCVKDIEKRLQPHLEYSKARPYRHAAREMKRQNVNIVDHVPSHCRQQFEGLYDEVQETKQYEFEHSTQFLKQFVLSRMGNRFEGFNPKYNKFSECYDKNVIFDEVRRSKLTSPNSSSRVVGKMKDEINEKMKKWLESQMEKGKRIPNQKHLDQMETIKKEQYDRVHFLNSEKGQGRLTEADKEWRQFPSPMGTRLSYIKKDQ